MSDFKSVMDKGQGCCGSIRAASRGIGLATAKLFGGGALCVVAGRKRQGQVGRSRKACCAQFAQIRHDVVLSDETDVSDLGDAPRPTWNER